MIPFGVSVGDFITGINLLIDAVHSLNDTHGAQADYEELGRQLKNLGKGFECIEDLHLDATQSPQASAVNEALKDCRLCVDGFVKRNSRFKSLETTSRNQWSLAALKRQGRKVKWALWKKADVAKFQVAIQQHSDAIQMLLASIQIKQVDTQGRLQATAQQHNVEHKDLTQKLYGRLSDLSLQEQRMERMLGDGQELQARGLVDRLAGIRDDIQSYERSQGQMAADQSMTSTQVLEGVGSINLQLGTLIESKSSTFRDTFALQEQLLTIMETQQQMMAQLRNIEVMVQLHREIPAQVPLSKPVTLLDARGGYVPFHIEFIDSAEALVAVLKVRFKDVGLRKIESREFALQDSRMKRALQLTKPWATIVRPGQHIDMSMVFRLEETPTTRCPSCGEDNAGSDLEDVECGNKLCGITYRRIVEEPDASSDQTEDYMDVDPELIQRAAPEAQPIESIDIEMQHYTRLHILTQGIYTRNSPVEFRQALGFVDKVKTRFVTHPETYKQFLEILTAYQAESKPFQDVYAEISALFTSTPDLLEGFKRFIPKENRTYFNSERSDLPA